jgi:hypothetical protein
MVTWREYAELIGPPWSKRYWGQRFWLGLLGYIGDLVAEAGAQAVRAHMLREDSSPGDALPPIGNERQMPRYPAETNANYRARLIDAWDAWQGAGTNPGIVSQYNAYGLSNVVVRSFHDGWGFENPPVMSRWSRFVVIIEQPHPWSTSYTYGSGILYGTPITFGSTATPDEAETVKAIALKWKPAHSINPYVLVVLEHEYYGDPDLVWGAAGVVYGGETIQWTNFPP